MSAVDGTGLDRGGVETISRAYHDKHSDDPTEILFSPEQLQRMIKDIGLNPTPKRIPPFHYSAYFECTDFGPYDEKEWRSRLFPLRGIVPVPRNVTEGDNGFKTLPKPGDVKAVRDGTAEGDASALNSSGDAIVKNNPLLTTVESIVQFITKYLPLNRAKLSITGMLCYIL